MFLHLHCTVYLDHLNYDFVRGALHCPNILFTLITFRINKDIPQNYFPYYCKWSRPNLNLSLKLEKNRIIHTYCEQCSNISGTNVFFFFFFYQCYFLFCRIELLWLFCIAKQWQFLNVCITRCEVEGCDRGFETSTRLRRHMMVHNKGGYCSA